MKKIPRSGKSPATRDASNEFPTISLRFTTKRAAFYIQFHKLTSAEAHEILLLQPRERQEEEAVVVKKHITLISCITTFSTLALFKWRKYTRKRKRNIGAERAKIHFLFTSQPGPCHIHEPAWSLCVPFVDLDPFCKIKIIFFSSNWIQKIGNREMFETGFHVGYALGRGAKTSADSRRLPYAIDKEVFFWVALKSETLCNNYH